MPPAAAAANLAILAAIRRRKVEVRLGAGDKILLEGPPEAREAIRGYVQGNRAVVLAALRQEAAEAVERMTARFPERQAVHVAIERDPAAVAMLGWLAEFAIRLGLAEGSPPANGPAGAPAVAPAVQLDPGSVGAGGRWWPVRETIAKALDALRWHVTTASLDRWLAEVTAFRAAVENPAAWRATAYDFPASPYTDNPNQARDPVSWNWNRRIARPADVKSPENSI